MALSRPYYSCLLSTAKMADSSPSGKSLSERPLGYRIAVVGGLLAAPLGLLTSPGLLFLLNQTMKGRDGKRPNRFLAWALLGIIGVPISLAIGNPGFRDGFIRGFQKGYNDARVEKSK